MIDYFKKVIILKRAEFSKRLLKGLVIVESLNSVTTLNFNFSCKLTKEYKVYVSGDTEIKVISGKDTDKFKVTYDDFSVLNGVTIAIFDSNGLTSFGEYGKSFYDLNGITNYAKTEYNETKKEQNFAAESIKTCKNQKPNEYDDERIATENYYQINDEENDLSIQNANLHQADKKAEEIEENSVEFREYETNSRPIEEWDYYEKIKDKLDEIFNSFERCNDLKETLPNGEFIKIRYADNDFYYVGKIFENDAVKYLCYGVTGYQNQIPNEILNNFNFIPISNYELSGKGFYLLFQDAKTGEIIKKQE